MHIAGIVAEYNPFHNGHAHHLCQTREAGAEAVVAVMSGNFVQRGDASVLSKWARAETAVRGGVDLVVELPLYWATSGAQGFAYGAVSTLQKLGCVQMLSFGSECGDAERIRYVAELVNDYRVGASLRSAMEKGVSFASAREAAVRTLFGDVMADVLHNPNDTLAVEYCLAAKRCEADFSFHAVPRVGAAHDSPAGTEAFLSASAIRVGMQEGHCTHCPETTVQVWEREQKAGRAPASLASLERMILAKLRASTPSQIGALPDVTEGLENRLLSAAMQASSLQELYDITKTKRYSHARIRRIVLCSLLDIHKEDIPADVPYIRVLAMNKKGMEILREAKKTASVPILTKMTDVSDLGEEAERVFQAEFRSTELYNLLLPKVSPSGTEMTTPIYIER